MGVERKKALVGIPIGSAALTITAQMRRSKSGKLPRNVQQTSAAPYKGSAWWLKEATPRSTSSTPNLGGVQRLALEVPREARKDTCSTGGINDTGSNRLDRKYQE